MHYCQRQVMGLTWFIPTGILGLSCLCCDLRGSKGRRFSRWKAGYHEVMNAKNCREISIAEPGRGLASYSKARKGALGILLSPCYMWGHGSVWWIVPPRAPGWAGSGLVTRIVTSGGSSICAGLDDSALPVARAPAANLTTI